MKTRSSHNKLTKSILPWLDEKVIDDVNKAIDSASSIGKLISAATGGVSKNEPLLRMGISPKGHRKYNHDAVSAMLTGYSVAGYDGVLAGLAHLVEDRVSDELLKINARDIFEAFLRKK